MNKLKKYIYFFIIILIPIFSYAGWFSGSRSDMGRFIVSSGCTKDTGTLVMDDSSFVNTGSQSMNTNAIGQSISYGSDWSLYSIELEFNNNSNCVASVRIGNSADLSTYMEEWNSVSIADGNTVHEFISIDNDSYSSSTTYYIGVIEVSGTCYLRYDGNNPYANGSSIYIGSSGWNMGTADTNRDFKVSVYKCQ